MPSTARISKTALRTALADGEKSADLAGLHYSSDTSPGISRVKKGKSFSYTKGDKPVEDENLLARIRALVLPPAWERVWICPDPLGHLQATGYDVAGRKQYRYHPDWHVLRGQTKYYRLLHFAKALPAIRESLSTDLARQGMPMEKVLATAVSILQETGIRIGNSTYEKLHGSFGLSTLRNNHVKVSGGSVQFTFKGKKGVQQKLSLKSRRLARIVQACRDLPGKTLFQYLGEDGEVHTIDSGAVNGYIKAAAGGDFTAKDFRTWVGTTLALDTFKALGCAETEAETKRRVLEVLDTVSAGLGNTRAVCKKYYVHPGLVASYECREIEQHLKALADEPDKITGPEGLSPTERLLLKILSQPAG